MRLIKRSVFAFLFLLVGANTCLAKDTISKISLDVQAFTLENGMMFLVVERPSMPQVACRLAIRTGSASEDTGRTGLAHLLEHMMFKGTKNLGTLDVQKDKELQERIEALSQTILAEEGKRTPDQDLVNAKRAEMNALRMEVQKIYVPHAFFSALEKNGARGINAFTSKDQTQYTASIPSDMLEQWFSIISEQLFEPSWREFYVEREVIQREWAFRYINDPNGASFMDLYAAAFEAHPYRNPVIGWKSDMEQLSTDDAILFHKIHYNPTNAVCVLVGDVTVDHAKALAGVYFKRYPAGKRTPERVTLEPVQQGPRKRVRYLKGARTPLVRIGFHTMNMGTKDFYALDVLSAVLSEGRSARMTQHIVEKGLAVDAWGYNPDNRYGSLFILGGSPIDPDALKDKALGEEERHGIYLKACEELEDTLLAELETLKTDLITEQELRRVKKLNERSFLDRLRSNEQLAGTLATLEVQVGWRYMVTYLENLAAVTPEEVRDAVRRYFRPDKKTSIYVIPGGQPDRPPESYTEIRSADRSATGIDHQSDNFVNNSIYPTPDGWKHPLSFVRQPEKIRYPKAETLMANDNLVFYLEDRELPLVDLYLLYKAGRVDVKEEKQGLAGILNGCVIHGGTENYSPSELALALDENGIRLSVAVHEEQTVVSLSVIEEDWEKGLELLSEILIKPSFNERILNVTKQRALTSLKRQGGDAMAVARRESKIWHFKGHPYGRDPLDGLETIPSITREDLKAFMQKHLVSSNMTAALAGHIEKTKALPGLSKFFKSFSKEAAPVRELDEPKETPPVLALIHKPGQVQSQVWMTLPSVKRTHPSYWKINLLMEIMGGSGSLMYTRLRDDLGLIYSGGFFQTYKWDAGLLMGYIGCKGDRTGKAIHETIRIMDGVRKEVPKTLLKQKRLDVLNGFVFNVDTPAALVKTYATYHMRGEPLETLEIIQDAFIRATKNELEVLSRKYLDPKKLQVFVVGDKTTKVKNEGGRELSLEEELTALAKELKLPYKEISLR